MYVVFFHSVVTHLASGILLFGGNFLSLKVKRNKISNFVIFKNVSLWILTENNMIKPNQN